MHESQSMWEICRRLIGQIKNSPVPSQSFGLLTSVSIFTGQSERALSSGHHEKLSQCRGQSFKLLFPVVVLACLFLTHMSGNKPERQKQQISEGWSKNKEFRQVAGRKTHTHTHTGHVHLPPPRVGFQANGERLNCSLITVSVTTQSRL